MGNITNILVIEDEAIVSKDIQNRLKKMGHNVVGAADTGEKAVDLAEELKPDIILMDIMLKGKMTGIDAATIIREKLGTPIIFLTAYADESTLAKAKITEPHGYILKPFKEIDLHTSIEMSLYKYKREREIIKERDMLYSIVENQGGKDFIFVKSNSRLVKLNVDDIYFIEALKDYVVINTNAARYTIHSTMKEIERKLSGDNFIRVHRSFIVRINKISAIEHSNLYLEDNKKVIPIGGSYKEELVKRINLV